MKQKQQKYFLGIMITFFLLGALNFGCRHANYIQDDTLRETAKKLDKIEKMVEEWGTASTSELLLIEDNGQFALDYSQKTEAYVEKARSAYQGAAWRALEQLQEVQQVQRDKLDVQDAAANAYSAYVGLPTLLSPDPNEAKAIDPLLKVMKSDDTDTDTGSEDEDEGEGEDESKTDLTPAFQPIGHPNPLANYLSNPKLEPLQSIAAPATSISERKSLLIGVNDKITERLLSVLANPGKVITDDKRIFMGIMQVSVNPGWHTRRDYIADIQITPEYYRKVLNGDRYSLDPYYLAGQKAPQPVVLSVFPLLEAQTLDLRNDERYQTALLNYISTLATLGSSSLSSENLSTFLDRLQYSGSSRSPIPVVTSYSNGNGFGFQFMPAYQALGDPADKKLGSANVLHPYSFPALVFLICDKNDLIPKGDFTDEGELALGWDHIAFTVNTRWIPIKEDKLPWLPYNPLQRTKRFGVVRQVAFASMFDQTLKNYREYIDNMYNLKDSDHFYSSYLHSIYFFDFYSEIQNRISVISDKANTNIRKIKILFPRRNLSEFQNELTLLESQNLSSRNEEIKLATINSVLSNLYSTLQKIENPLENFSKSVADLSTLNTPIPRNSEDKVIKLYEEVEQIFNQIRYWYIELNQIKKAYADSQNTASQTPNENKIHINPLDNKWTVDEIERRIRELGNLGMGRFNVTRIPQKTETAEAQEPDITGVQPTRGFYNAQTVLAIKGEGFKHGDNDYVKAVTVGGRDCEFVVASDSVLLAIVPPWTTNLASRPPSIPEEEIIVATPKGIAISENFVKFNNSLEFSDPDPTITVLHQAEGLIRSISLNQQIPNPDQLLQTIRDILRKPDIIDELDVTIPSQN